MKNAGRDSWLVVAAAGLIIIISCDYIMKVWSKKKCSSLKEVFEGALGKRVGNLFLFLFAIMLFITMVECAAVETSVIHTNLFIESPQWYILFFVSLPGLYIIKKGKNAAIVVIMIAIVISIINGINLYFLTAPFKDYRRLFPIMENGITYGFILAVIKVIGLYSSIFIAIAYLKEIKSTKNLRRCAFISSAFVVQMIIASTNGIITTFAVERGNLLVYPKLIQTQLISYFGFIASGEFYVIFQVLAGWFAKYIVTFFALINVLKELKAEKLYNMDFLPYSITLVVYAVAYYESENLIRLFNFLNFYSFLCLVGYLIMPLAIFSIFALRRKNKS